MVSLKYDIQIQNETLYNNLSRLINHCYKILCYKEEKTDWEKPLRTVILEVAGLQRLLDETLFLVLLSKLESLYLLQEDSDFFDFRRTIFDCLGILDEVKNNARIR